MHHDKNDIPIILQTRLFKILNNNNNVDLYMP